MGKKGKKVAKAVGRGAGCRED